MRGVREFYNSGLVLEKYLFSEFVGMIPEFVKAKKLTALHKVGINIDSKNGIYRWNEGEVVKVGSHGSSLAD
jgi:hypothetical protein